MHQLEQTFQFGSFLCFLLSFADLIQLSCQCSFFILQRCYLFGAGSNLGIYFGNFLIEIFSGSRNVLVRFRAEFLGYAGA